MNKRETGYNLYPKITGESVFDSPAQNFAPEFIMLLKLAEKEGAYARLTPGRRETLEQYVIKGLSMAEIARGLGVSKQAVSQRLKLIPESLYKYMLRDITEKRTEVGITELLTTYAAFKHRQQVKKDR